MPLGERRSDACLSGIYGLRLVGLDRATGLFAEADDDSDDPVVRVRRVDTPMPADAAAPLRDELAPDAALFTLQGGVGHVSVEREPLQARFALPDSVPDEAVVHPFLALPAAAINWWLGRISLHGGAFVGHDGAAYGILGDKEAGKTTTLAAMHAAGHAIVADDVLAIDGTDVLAGPACIDLRTESAHFIEGAHPLGVVGERARWRIPTQPARWRTPLGGFVIPAWGDDVALHPLPVHERLQLLFANQSLFVPPRRPEAMLDLVALPFWEVRRPRDLGALDATVELLQELSG